MKDPVALESALARSQTKLNALKALRQEKMEENEKNKKAVHEEIVEALAMVADHHSYVEKRFKEVKEVGGRLIEEVEGEGDKLPPPPKS